MGKLYSCQLKFETRYSDFDFRDQVKISSYLNFMQEAAGISANELGCGSNFLWPRGWGFIVTHNYLEIYKPLAVSHPVGVMTWPLPPRHVSVERHYEMYDEEGQKIAAAVSRWCLLDLQNKKLLPMSALTSQDFSIYNPQKTMDFKDWKIAPVSTEGLAPSFAMRVFNSDYDHYQHVNNTRYADFCLNCFSLEELQDMDIKSFQISYEEQCTEGEELRFYRVELGENKYLIAGVKGDNQTFMRAKIAFSKK